MHVSASSDRSSQWASIYDCGRVVVREHRSFRDVLVVERQFHVEGDHVSCVRGNHALRQCITYHLCLHFTKLVPYAEGVVSIVDVGGPVEGHEATSFECDVGPTGNGAEIGLKLLDHWVIVVPEAEPLQCVLLSVQGNREGHLFAHDRRLRRSAPNERVGDELRLRTLGTEVAPEVISQIEEVGTPYLNDGVTILGTVTRVKRVNSGRLVVSVGPGRVHIVKLAGERD